MQVSLLSVITIVAFAMNVAAGPVPDELLPRKCSGIGTCGNLICKVKSGCTCSNAGCLKESSRICTCA
ncbi:uncharacterized protein GGS22DRAFT_185820 [Annulohypoxylon maeteangense]|uniref:uncharacterized protein n=1 Tax=Annulohypoxylon maeteangense TaxID=1927788 RepID=UPI002007C701|nr:uncharacterized protein GGS22DRAFT_185820 [Annulohypoxylon maeteangense]KAI0888441.1 hypothetical protein GGS22DRAFT_185820 [Annulohypoxylon maeteangense]